MAAGKKHAEKSALSRARSFPTVVEIDENPRRISPEIDRSIAG